MTLYLVIYFFAGVLQDFLLTLNWRFVAREKAFSASLFSFLTTVVSMLVVYNIITKLDEERSILAIIVYSLGIASGTLLGLKIKIHTK